MPDARLQRTLDSYDSQAALWMRLQAMADSIWVDHYECECGAHWSLPLNTPALAKCPSCDLNTMN
jgi:hypothetical protein